MSQISTQKINRMDQDFKTNWVTALRSGNYEQTQFMLRAADGSGFCCLGVACDIHDPSRWDFNLREGTNKDYVPYRASPWHSDTAFLPEDIVEKYNIPNGLISHVMEMNDQERRFEEIADYIEFNW